MSKNRFRSRRSSDPFLLVVLGGMCGSFNLSIISSKGCLILVHVPQ
jgi:hypothetical protein